MPKAKKIPDRWEMYGSFGDVIKGTNILPLKVPLKMTLSSRLPEKERFTPDDFLDKLDDMNYKLGLLIDLTATTRYYNPNVFIDRGVQYVKVFTQGHVVPSPEVIDKFTSEVSSFLEDNKDLIIGVHCTHGVNRTGYLICRYLIEQEGYKPEDALKAFKEARGYPIERKNYIEDLLQLSCDRRESVHSKGSHVEHFQEKRKNDHYRTRNNYDHDWEIRRGHHHRFHNPYHWNGGAPQVAYGNTLHKKPFWGSQGRSGEGNWRRDGGMNYEETWDAWQGDGASGAGRWDRNGPNWRQDGDQYKWSSYNQRTPQRSGCNRRYRQEDKSKTWRNIHKSGY